jgi:adenylate cyclase
LERRLAAIVATDVVGYSRLMAADEAGTHARLRALRKDFLEPKTAEHHGRVVKLTGDGALIEFASVVDAVECAAALQTGVAERQAELPEDRRIAFRIGINIGDIMIEEGDIYGDGVNIAARLEGLAEPGGICLARNVYNQVKGKVAFGFEPMGDLRVKNIPEPVTVYRLLPDAGEVATQLRPKRAGMAGWRRAALGVAALALLTAAGVAAWLQPWRHPAEAPTQAAAPPVPDKPSIAVLPFENLSDNPEEGYFADGLTDDLITDLSKISGLLTIARNSVFIYKDKPIDIRQVATELGVRYVLEGSVRRAGDRVRVNAQLIDSETGGHLWADRFDRDASDIFTVQDEVTRHIVDALAVQLSVSEQQRLQRLPTTNLEAYDFFLRAEELARTGFRPQLRQAMRLYAKATELDPSFADAYAADARTAADVWRGNYDDIMPGPMARKRAYEHASIALKLDLEASLPFAVLAVLQLVDRLYDEALASAERAVALGPGDAEAHATLSFVLTFSGRYAEAIAAIEAAMRLNPNLPTGDRQVAGLAFLLNKDPERAIEILERARAEAPQVDDTHALLAAAYVRAGRDDRARAAAAEARRAFPAISVSLYRVIWGYLRNSHDLAQILGAMQQAGLSEWPYGFRGDERGALSGVEIESLAFGRTWLGKLEGVGPALMQIGRDGNEAFRTPTQIRTGVAFIDGEMLCERSEGSFLGRPVCGPVYRRPKDSVGNDARYVYVNASKLFYFTPVE